MNFQQRRYNSRSRLNGITECHLIFLIQETDAAAVEKARQEFEQNKRIGTLFDGKKVFLNREVPREMLVFLIRYSRTDSNQSLRSCLDVFTANTAHIC